MIGLCQKYFFSSVDVSTDENNPEAVDYVDMKSIAKKIKTRRQFHPQFHIIDAWGDVRLRVGQRFKRRGANIPREEIELVVSEVTFIEDASGFHMVVKAVNKFEVPAQIFSVTENNESNFS